MENNAFIGALVIGVSALVTLYISFRNIRKDNEAPVEKLTEKICELITQTSILNAQLGALNDKVDNSDERITKHGVEIDSIKDKVISHEARLNILENAKD